MIIIFLEKKYRKRKRKDSKKVADYGALVEIVKEKIKKLKPSLGFLAIFWGVLYMPPQNPQVKSLDT